MTIEIDKKEAIDLIHTLIHSCNQGYSGEWDSGCEEGREAFLDMRILLERLKAFVKKEIGK